MGKIQRIPFKWGMGVGITFFVFYFLGLWIRHGFNDDTNTFADALICSVLFSVAFGYCTYLCMKLYRTYASQYREECYTEGTEPALARKLYLFRLRGLWYKVLMKFGEILATMSFVYWILYASESTILPTRIGTPVFLMAATFAVLFVAMCIRRRAMRDSQR